MNNNGRIETIASYPPVSGSELDVALGNFIGRSRPILEVFRKIARIAPFNTTVLISGESGTGKERIARLIHLNSPLRNMPFVALNCAAVPENLLESELFGYVRGAFSGAVRDKRGYFEEADKGTLLLDEVSEFPIGLQAKLLRVLQEGKYRRLGDTEERTTDVRVVAVTSRNLEEEVRHGRFREDLYYRLNILPVVIPPLRKRREDIAPLVQHFLEVYGKGRPFRITDAAMQKLTKYSWPGNVRELQNIMERAVVMAESSTIDVGDLPMDVAVGGDQFGVLIPEEQVSIKQTLSELVPRVERELIRRALQKTNNNRTRAARLLEISHRSLLYKLKEYNCG